MNKEDIYYQQLVRKMAEVALVTPQNVGPFTPLYKRLTPYLKQKPWKALSLGAIFITGFLYILFGSLLVRLASILQFGF